MKCYLCHNSSNLFLQAKKRVILRCNHCKLIFTSDHVLNSGISREDSKKFVIEYLAEEKLYEEYFNNKLNLLFKYHKPGLLLDIGCGAGVFLRCAKEKGWNVIGVDMSTSAVKHARSLGLDVRLGKFEKLKFNPETFDIITIFQTIEHIEDPLNFMKKAYDLLRPNGIFLVTTPNADSLMARIMGKRWFGYRNIEHIFFYNNRSLKSLLRKSGFNNVIIRKENGRSLTISWILTRIFGYYYNHHSLITKIMLKSSPLWKYLNWFRFHEPEVNLVSVAIK